MDSVAQVVNAVLDSRGWRGKVLEQMAVEIWPEVVGETIARHTMALRFKGGTLYVRARSPQWTQELHFQEARITARLNGRLRQNLVQKIRCSVTPPRGIKVGALKPNWEDPSFPETPPLPRSFKPDKNDAAAKQAAEIAAQIEDPEMREVMENLIASSIRVRTAREQEKAAEKEPKPSNPVKRI
jgi:hypothetical protein